MSLDPPGVCASPFPLLQMFDLEVFMCAGVRIASPRYRVVARDDKREAAARVRRAM